MRTKDRKRIIAGLAAAAGATAAFFGMRRLINWQKNRSFQADYGNTGSDYGYNRQMQYSNIDNPGQVSTGQQTPVGAVLGGTRYQPHDQPDRQPIPMTGMAAANEMAREVTRPETPEIGGLVDPLLQYLMSFHGLINLLRSRRQLEENTGRDRTLSPEDRASSQEVIDRLEETLSQYSEGDFKANSLEGRVYRMLMKVRDGLQNLDYTDDDLFRIHGEVRSDACRMLDELPSDPTVTDLDLVRQMYECQ